MMAEDTGVWLYAVTLDAGPSPLTGHRGVAAEAPRTIAAAGLVAVVGDVPLDAFGEAALRRNLEDLDWLAAIARAHDVIIAALGEAGPVVPIRLATVYRDDESVRLVLQRRADEFGTTLDRVAGRTEWGVKVFVEPRPEPGAGSTGGTGIEYLTRRKAALASQEQGTQRAVDQANRVHSALSALAAATCTHPPRSQALAGDDTRMILNAAYLVDDKDERRFVRSVAACDDANDAIRVRLTGPWSPYSFAFAERS